MTCLVLAYILLVPLWWLCDVIAEESVSCNCAHAVLCWDVSWVCNCDMYTQQDSRNLACEFLLHHTPQILLALCTVYLTSKLIPVQALLSDANQGTLPSREQAHQLLLLAELCAGCEDTGDASPKAADTAEPKETRKNAEAVEGLLTAVRSAKKLPELLLGLVKAYVQQLQQADAPSATVQLPEALPGEAPGCGELLKTCKHQQTLAW